MLPDDAARSRAFFERMARDEGVSDPNHVKPGLGEATRVLLRRVPDLLLLRDPDDPEVAHLKVLADEKDVPIRIEADLPYRAAALIKRLASSRRPVNRPTPLANRPDDLGSTHRRPRPRCNPLPARDPTRPRRARQRRQAPDAALPRLLHRGRGRRP